DSADTINLNASGLNITGDLSLSAGTIAQTQPVAVAGLTTLDAGPSGSITLNNAGNDFGTVAITSALNATLRDTNAIDLGTSSVAGTLNVTSNGAITDSGNLSVTGTATLAAGAGNSITLNSAGNDFATVAITSALNATLRDTNAIDLGTSSVAGTLNVTSNGAITDSGNLSVTGTATLAAGAGNSITLN